MNKLSIGAAVMFALGAHAVVAAAQVQPAGPVGTPNYDVVLEVPELDVDSLGINVETLQAHLALDANAMNLVALNAGVDVSIDQVQLDLVGVFAEAYLYVDLDNVNRVVGRVVQTLEANPELLTQLLSTVDTAVATVGGVADELVQPGGAGTRALGVLAPTLRNLTAADGLLSQTVDTVGQVVQRTVDQSGNVVERTFDTTGALVGSRSVGNVLDLGGRVLRETTDAAGRTVRRVTDSSGTVVEYTLDAGGRIMRTSVVE